MKNHERLDDPFEILVDIASVHDRDSQFNKILNYIPNRNLSLEFFGEEFGESTSGFVNIHSRVQDFFDKTKLTVMLIAHWDVRRYGQEYDNVVDNLGSVAILLCLANRLRKQPPHRVNVEVVLTDFEEGCDPHRSGAGHLCTAIESGNFGERVEAINFECNALGTVPWVSHDDGFLRDDARFIPVTTPFSDAHTMNLFGQRCSTIGILPERDIANIESGRFPETWDRCHSTEDKIELANRVDLCNFAEFVEDLIGSVS